jgi:hypothetical protein
VDPSVSFSISMPCAIGNSKKWRRTESNKRE